MSEKKAMSERARAERTLGWMLCAPAVSVMVLVTAALGWVLSRGSLRPIAAITRTARRISSRQRFTVTR